MAGKMRYDIEGLARLEQAIAKAKKIRSRVGILGKKPERAGAETNADLGAKHEFGYVVSDGAFKGAMVPARSFLRMPFRTHIEVVLQMVKPRVTSMLAAGNIGGFFAVLGIAAEKLVDRAFDTSGWGTWKANAPTTVILKGSDKPLIDKGFLRRSISSVVVKVK